MVVSTYFRFLSNQSMPGCIASFCDTTVISRLNIDPVTDPSLMSIKGVSCLGIKHEEISSENEKRLSEKKPS